MIRKNAPDSVVLVGTRGFSSLGLTDGADEQEILDDPVDFKNVMYTFHFYAASHKRGPAGGGGPGGEEPAAVRQRVRHPDLHRRRHQRPGQHHRRGWTCCKSLKISYAMWSLSDGRETNSAFKQGACAGTKFAGTDVLTESGNFMRTRIREASGAE